VSGPTAFERVRRAYVATALITFNTLVVVVIASVLVAVALELTYRVAGRHKYSAHLDLDSYTELPRETAVAVGKELDEYGENQSFVYNPWATFMVAPRAGRLFNVDTGRTANVRRTTGGTPPASPSAPDVVVWFFGGSTVFGWGLPDNYTIPSLLQDRLQRALPDRRVRIVNFGQPYWFTSSELALFVALLRNEAKPTAAVFLDGLNDTVWSLQGIEEPVFAPRAEQGWNHERSIERGEAAWISFNPTFPPFAVVKHLAKRGVFAAGDERAAYRRPSPDPVARTVEIYRRNRDMALALGRASGVAVSVFLQPTRFYSARDRAKPAEARSGPQRAYQILSEEAASGAVPRFATLHTAVDDIAKPFVDQGHYSDAASRRIAERLASALGPELGR
jgi:lysophospholipase L1-like esterase